MRPDAGWTRGVDFHPEGVGVNVHVRGRDVRRELDRGYSCMPDSAASRSQTSAVPSQLPVTKCEDLSENVSDVT